jgi:K+/H+ antiporter YhaU regulatory subunit KhtT
MKKISMWNKIKYAFDNLMSKGTLAMVALLGALSIIIVLISATIIALFKIQPTGEKPLGFIEGFWLSMMRTLDPGTMGGDAGWSFRIIAFIVTIGGIFIISTLIGVLNNGIESHLDKLREGKSFVIENNHTLILGWSSKIFTIISELQIANENVKKPRIVILANREKVEMESEIRSAFPKLKQLKIICRSGAPDNLTDINMVNPNNAKSIIVLNDDNAASDSIIIKTILAIINNPNRRQEPYHILTEIKDESNLEIVKMIGKEEVEVILTDDIIGRIIIQTSRQSGLSMVYQELMDFDGDEIYFSQMKELTGQSYGDSLMQFKESSVIGIFNGENQQVLINPSMDYVIQAADEIIAITKDNDTLIPSLNPKYKIKEHLFCDFEEEVKSAEKMLILGWNKRAIILLREINEYVVEGSKVDIYAHFEVSSEIKSQVQSEYTKLIINFYEKDTTSREVLQSIQIFQYDNIQVLCYREELETQEADANTLITLLHLRRISEEQQQEIKIVSEMLDVKNRELAEITKADDFIVSDKLISLLMSQVSENKQLMRVFEDLLRSEGSEIYLKQVKNYMKLSEPVDFYSIIESAKRRGETAIGYRLERYHNDSQKAYGVVINPLKSDLINFSEKDKIIVLAEEG